MLWNQKNYSYFVDIIWKHFVRKNKWSHDNETIKFSIPVWIVDKAIAVWCWKSVWRLQPCQVSVSLSHLKASHEAMSIHWKQWDTMQPQFCLYFRKLLYHYWCTVALGFTMCLFPWQNYFQFGPSDKWLSIVFFLFFFAITNWNEVLLESELPTVPLDHWLPL